MDLDAIIHMSITSYIHDLEVPALWEDSCGPLREAEQGLSGNSAEPSEHPTGSNLTVVWSVRQMKGSSILTG